ncbi:hypothetical protein BOX15_Mlig025158g1 [Macrostomum lignano]|uniref:Ig-like domain-containing protein n=1 Tax=Macrostomum lignano TaxID=282301 RepID=A0A267F101_9PLAT|nr:hypothetical protein BOX15_Mlig025158g1 [Macrostomum lignano]
MFVKALLIATCFSALILTGESSASLMDSSLLGISLQQIQARSPYKYVREVVVAAEGETKAITCSFDNLFTTGKHWKKTFYSPVVWFSYSPNASSKAQPAREEPVADGTVLRFDGGNVFAYKLLNPMSVAPSSILVLENLPRQLTDTYFICKTNLHPASVQAFYLKVVKPVLFSPSSSSGGGRVAVQLGGRATLDCSGGGGGGGEGNVRNFPPTSVHWSRRLEDESQPARPSVLAWGSAYELNNVTIETARCIFTCHVNNQLDPEWTASFRLDLINATMPPPGPITATYNGIRSALRADNPRATPRDGESFTLACSSRGESLRFTWLRNGTQLMPFADPNLFLYSSAVGSLHISDLLIRSFRPSNRGLYQCVASNVAGRSGFVFNLTGGSSTTDRDRLGTLTTPGGPGGVGTGGGTWRPTMAGQQQQQLGSGWGAGSGDDEWGDADFGSGDGRPEAPATTGAAPPSTRRRRRAGRHSLKIKRLMLP